METKQTAVEWLEQELFQRYNFVDNEFIFHQAKAMHKEQIKDAYEYGENNIDSDGCHIDKNGAELYYNETYGK